MADMQVNFGTRRAAAGRGTMVLLPSLWAVAAWAACICGYDDGAFTLTTIAADGIMAEWAPVHGDLDNNACDGPSGGLADRDAPIQSTGRDLTHFAFTWDQNNLYLFTERFGSTSNQQTFAYYADIDNDRLMETGEPVIGVTWRGSNRRINVYVFNYVAQAPGGDPMVDGNGYADGYTLPGSFANVPSTGNPNRSGNWGSRNGLQMEFPVTWAELGVAPGSPFTFHVSSSNASLGASSFPQQVDDNLSGCGGGLGSTSIWSVTMTPDLTLAGISGQTVVGAHTLTNTGNASDYFDLSSSISGDFSPAIRDYEDVDGSGTITAADVLLADTDGDTDPDTRILAPAESATILIAYVIPGSAGAGETATVQTSAASDFQPLASDTVTDTVSTVIPPELVITKDSTTLRDPFNDTNNPKAIPGSEVLYSINVSNQGQGTVDDDAIVITDSMPGEACMSVLDLAGPGTGPVEFRDGSPSSDLDYSFLGLASNADDLEFSNDGGLTFNYVPSANALGCDPSITDLRINPKGRFAADTGAGSPSAVFSFRIVVN